MLLLMISDCFLLLWVIWGDVLSDFCCFFCGTWWNSHGIPQQEHGEKSLATNKRERGGIIVLMGMIWVKNLPEHLISY